jgi:nitrogen fixation NifU-like protein
MNEELMELYQQMILDHGKRPRNFGDRPDAERSADGHNPLCGDRCRVHLDLDGDRIEQVGFSGEGCAISTASASLMTEAVNGMTLDEARDLFERLHELVTDGQEIEDPRLGKLAVFAGVRQFPLRVKCATLAWHTLLAAIEDRDETVRTEP